MRLGIAYAVCVLGICYLLLTQTNFLPWQLISTSDLKGIYDENAALKARLTRMPLKQQLPPLGTASSLDRGAYNRDSNVTHRAVYVAPNGLPYQGY